MSPGDLPRPTGTLIRLGGGLERMTWPEHVQMAPRTRLDQTSCRHAVCVGSPLFSACVSTGPLQCSLAVGHPAPPHQPPAGPGCYGPRTGAAHSGGRANRMLVRTEMPARPSQSRTSWVRVLHVTAQGAIWPRAPTLAPCPFPCTPSLTPDKPCLPWTLGEPRKGGVLSLRRGCVCPVAAAPRDLGQARGRGEQRA